MCDTQSILHQNKIGYVSVCNECEHIHIEIGTFMVVFRQKSFKRFLNDLQKKKKNNTTYFRTSSGAKLLIRLTDNSFISLTKEEFEETIELLELSNHLLNVKQILKY